MSAVGRVMFNNLLRSALSRGLNNRDILRLLSLTSHFNAKSHGTPGSSDGEESVIQPIKFSTSKASHRTWRVERSMGSRFQRPWWKVLPLSMLAVGFLLWCAFREESDIDLTLEKHLFEHLPGLLSNNEESDVDKKLKKPDMKGN